MVEVSFQTWLIIFSLVIILVGSLAMWYGSVHLTKPISELNESVKAISRGDFNRKIPLKQYPKDTAKYHNELAQLSQHVNQMAEDLRRSDEHRSAFIANLSHELKTPLASLKILIENMKENIGRYKDRDHYLGVALGIVDDLSHHVLQILSLSSVQELRDEKEEVDLLQMTQSLVKDYVLLAKEREIQVDISLTRQQAYINPSVMKLILSNLISNAIKHSTPGGLVRIGEREGELFIENSCSPEEQEKLAQSFSGNASRKAKGSGMGLFVVKSLLEHEKLPYRFERQDDRLTFFIRFPRVSQD